jgi:hypothetical protein
MVPMKSILFLCMFCPLLYAEPCPVAQTKNEAALLQIEHTWAAALEKHDTGALECILAYDFEEAGADGQLFDRSNMLNRSRNLDEVRYELSDMHAHVYGDAGYVRGVGVAMGGNGKIRAKTRFTDIFVYRDGRWQCVAGHESMFPTTTHP